MMRVRKGKAWSMDGVAEGWFDLKTEYDKSGRRLEVNWEENRKKIAFCKSILRKEYWEKEESMKHLVSRLVLLNKKAPKIGDVEDFRPIAIMSQVVRFLEAFLVEDLRKFGRDKLAGEQVGFVEGQSVEVARNRLLKWVSERRKERVNCFTLFVDFSNAYNTVDRRKLAEWLERRGALSGWRLQLWRFLLGRSGVQLGGETIWTTNGVPQGSSVAPMGFDIYSEILLEKLREEG